MIEDQLVAGRTYFLVLFYDESLLIPRIRTLVYIGKNVLGLPKNRKDDEWLFQDPESYLRYGSVLNMKSTGEEREARKRSLIVDKGTLSSVYDIPGLIDMLADLRSKQGPVPGFVEK